MPERRLHPRYLDNFKYGDLVVFENIVWSVLCVKHGDPDDDWKCSRYAYELVNACHPRLIDVDEEFLEPYVPMAWDSEKI